MHSMPHIRTRSGAAQCDSRNRARPYRLAVRLPLSGSLSVFMGALRRGASSSLSGWWRPRFALPPRGRARAQESSAPAAGGSGRSGGSMNGTQPLLSIRNLKKEFPIRKGVFSRQVGAVKAVNDVSFDIARGETLGVVGESGCGKTTTGRDDTAIDRADVGGDQIRGARRPLDGNARSCARFGARCRSSFRIPSPRSIRA